MVPPFLAYYGVLNQNSTLVYEAYRQIGLYRSYLLDSSTHNLWKHIVFGSIIPPDEGHWATGNGWACVGTLKVIATIQHSEYADEVGSLTLFNPNQLTRSR